MHPVRMAVRQCSEGIIFVIVLVRDVNALDLEQEDLRRGSVVGFASSNPYRFR